MQTTLGTTHLLLFSAARHVSRNGGCSPSGRLLLGIPILLFAFGFLISFIWVFLRKCMSLHHMCTYSGQKEDTRSLRAEIADKCGCLESNPGPLEEVLITLSALQPRVSGFVGH